MIRLSQQSMHIGIIYKFVERGVHMIMNQEKQYKSSVLYRCLKFPIIYLAA